MRRKRKERNKTAKKTYYQRREDDLKLLISEIKIKNKLTDEQLSKLIPIPLSTFKKRKSHPGRFSADQVWRLERLAKKEVIYKDA